MRGVEGRFAVRVLAAWLASAMLLAAAAAAVSYGAWRVALQPAAWDIAQWLWVSLVLLGCVVLTSPLAWLLLQRERSREHELEQIIRHKPEQLRLQYQPVFDVRNYQCVGADALLRLYTDGGKLIPPDQVLSIFEHHLGMTRMLTRKVLALALRDLFGWLRRDPKRYVSVNITATDLDDREFPLWLSHELAGAGVRPSQLRLELAWEEGGLDMRQVDTLGKLRRLGVALWVDSYGVDGTTLEGLQDVAVDGVKLDRSCVEGLDRNDPEHMATIRAAVDEARSRGLQVGAEGVSSEPALAALRSLKVKFLQGYLLAKPCSAQQLIEVFEMGLVERVRERIDLMSRWPDSERSGSSSLMPLDDEKAQGAG